MGVSDTLVRVTSFGLLALLLEVCTLASIGLLDSVRVNGQNKKLANTGRGIPFDDDQSETDARKTKLIRDIQRGKTLPVIRKIRAMKYGLGIEAIKRVLAELKNAGVLEEDNNKSYRLKRKV